jgi:fermentation-respiration switch protein FrsA (DUF1100 family)
MSGCITLDGFWFDPQPLDAYELPGNRVPDHLLDEVVLTSSDGETLYGFLARRDRADGQGVTVVYCHGNYHHLDHYWPRVMRLWDLGYDVLAFDYRGYGRSTGTPSEAGIYEDGRTFVGWLATTALADQPVVYYGYSLGGAVAIQVATEQPPDVLLTESAFASAQALLEDSTALPLEAGLLMEGEFDNLGKIDDIYVPYMALHGTDDEFIRFRFSRLLVEAANEPKTLVPAVGAAHGEPGVPEILGAEYDAAVIGWIGTHVTSP